MKKIKMGPDSPGGKSSVSPSDIVNFVKSLYNDEWRWQITKSVTLFAAAVYVTRVIAEAPESVELVGPYCCWLFLCRSVEMNLITDDLINPFNVSGFLGRESDLFYEGYG